MSELQPLTEQELEDLTSDLQAVLEKHNAEMGVTSTINLMKRKDETSTEKDSGNDSAESDSE